LLVLPGSAAPRPLLIGLDADMSAGTEVAWLIRDEGLVKDEQQPFAAERRDAIDRSDLRLSRFGADAAILPPEGS